MAHTGQALRHAATELRGDRQVVEVAWSQDTEALLHASAAICDLFIGGDSPDD